MRRSVKEVMTPVGNLAVVDENSSLFEAILAIGAVRKENPAYGLRCPAALVSAENGQITGYLDFRGMLKSLEPRYGEIAETVMEKGFSPEWIESELRKYGLWADALEDICKKAGEITVKTLVNVPTKEQVLDANASLNEAVFQMVLTGNDYLFIKSGEKLTGVISLSDMVTHVCDAIKNCRV